MGLTNIPKITKHNLQTLRRQPLAEISGALGDLGTLLPLMIALALQHSISLSSTLVFSGAYNILTGVVFGIPLPVQPMKAIAAAAIASHASQPQTVAAGALVAIAVGLLSITGLLRWLTAHIPVPVVKGIQLGAGLQLVVSGGGKMLLGLPWASSPFDNRLYAIAAFVLLLLTARVPRRFPYALVLFLVGLILAIVAIETDPTRKNHHHSPDVWHPSFSLPAFDSPAAWSMAIAQLPLTTLNSVIAAAALASELFSSGAGHGDISGVSVTELGLSVALMNLVGCWFGAMPVCHGAGGLAAQYRFGARSGASIIILGLVKLVLGLFGAAALLDLLVAFPRALLGVMVIAAGLELARVGRSLNYGASDLWEEGEVEGEVAGVLSRRIRQHRTVSDAEREERWTVMLVTAAGILAFRNDAVGFVAGMVTYWANGVNRGLASKFGGARLGGERAPLLSS